MAKRRGRPRKNKQDDDLSKKLKDEECDKHLLCNMLDLPMGKMQEAKREIDEQEMAVLLTSKKETNYHVRQRTLRNSAVEALVRLQEYKEDPVSIQDVENDDELHKEYKITPEEENTTSEDSLGEEEKPMECATTTKHPDVRTLLKMDWEGKYELFEKKLHDVPKGMYKEWNQELKEKQMIRCKNEGCQKNYKSLPAMAYHAKHCMIVIEPNAICLLCKSKFFSAKYLLNHMIKKHKDPFNVITEQPKQIRRRRRTNRLQSLLYYVALARDFHLKNDLIKRFANQKPDVKKWTPLYESDIKKYLPLQKHSVNICFEEKNARSKWIKLELFESFSINDTSSNRTFFVGGPLWAGAWCPTPIDRSADQYVALSYCRNAEEIHNLVPEEPGKTLIEIWCMGDLPDDDDEIPMPTLRLGIAVDYSEVWDLAWCPSGCWENPLTYLQCVTENNTLPRLGLLSAACSDSCVRLYSIPHPLCLHRNYPHNNSLIYKAQPILVLKMPPMHKNAGICTKLSWQATGDCRILAGGYSNGLICCWDLLGTSPLLACIEHEQQILLPYVCFFGATAIITDLCWSPYENNQVLAVASSDRNFKIWDLKNPSVPISFNKLGELRGLHWSHREHGLYFANNSFSSDCKVQFVSYLERRHTSVTEHNAYIWSISVSDWHNIIASADIAGEVVGTSFQDPKKRKDRGSRYHLPIYRMDLKLMHLDTNSKELIEKQAPSPTGSLDSGIHEGITTEDDCEKEPLPDESYKEITSSYGLLISDSAECNYATSSVNEENEKVKHQKYMNCENVNQYPLASVNIVQWNPNYRYSSWLFSAGQAGLARLTRVKNARIIQSDLPKLTCPHPRSS